MARMGSRFYKHPVYGHVYGEPVATPQARIAWPALVKPKDPPPPQPGQAPGKPRYEVTLILEKESTETLRFSKVVELMANRMLDQFNNGRAAKIAGVEIFKDGDKFDLEKYPYYKGAWIIAARNTELPLLVNAEKAAVGADAFQGGQLCKLVVTPLVTAHGVSFKLNTVMLLKDDGVRFAGGAPGAASYLSLLSPEELPKDSPEAPAEEQEVTAKEAALKLL